MLELKQPMLLQLPTISMLNNQYLNTAYYCEDVVTRLYLKIICEQSSVQPTSHGGYTPLHYYLYRNDLAILAIHINQL